MRDVLVDLEVEWSCYFDSNHEQESVCERVGCVAQRIHAILGRLSLHNLCPWIHGHQCFHTHGEDDDAGYVADCGHGLARNHCLLSLKSVKIVPGCTHSLRLHALSPMS